MMKGLKKMTTNYVRRLLVYLIGRWRSNFSTQILQRSVSENNPAFLHLGAGTNILKNWINTDYYPHKNNSCHLDITKNFPIPTGTVDKVLIEHVLEHFSQLEARHILEYIYRILKKDGLLILAVPHLGFIQKLISDPYDDLVVQYIEYCSGRFLDTDAHYSLKRDEVINNFFNDWGHKAIYSEAGLRELIKTQGYKLIYIGNYSEAEPEVKTLLKTNRMPDGFVQLESLLLVMQK